MPHELSCAGTNRDGTACKAPPRLVDSDSGFCVSHDPARRAEIIEAARKGGQATAKRLRAPGLSESELPPLTSPEVAEVWLERIAVAVATGRLGHREGRSATAAVQQWLKAYEAGRMVNRLDTLHEQLADIRGRT